MVGKKYKYLLISFMTINLLGSTNVVHAEITTNSETTFIVDSSEEISEVETEKSDNSVEKIEIEETESEEIQELDILSEISSNRSDILPKIERPQLRSVENYLSIDEKQRPVSDFIDVSSHNNSISVEEFKLMKSYGVTGVVVKLTESTSYKNPYAKEQIKNAKEAGLLVSVYHYSWFKSEAQAIAEANYFAAMASELGLSKDTLMVNDIEEPGMKYKNGHTENSLAFEKQLNAKGYKNVNHYIGLHWINENRINPNALGMEKVWVAAYPYEPVKQQYEEYGAWQWTSKMTFPGVRGVFDMSSDYYGSYSIPPQGKYISDGRYVQINKKGYKTYSDFNWKERESTDTLYGKKFEARGRYEHINGSTYLSLYDNQGKWAGYLNANATSTLKGPQGNYVSDGRYVSISKKNYNIWQNFNFNQSNLNTNDVYEKTYLAKGKYEHFNGSTYVSLYDSKDNWLGYLNESAVTVAPNKNGSYIKDGRYATVTGTNYNTWRNFSWTYLNSPETIYKNTYLVKGRYENFNGSTYLSLFDGSDNWMGYVNQQAVSFSNDKQGIYMSHSGYASINHEDGLLYRNFDGEVKQKASDVYQNNYRAKGEYRHFDGAVYYSLYNDKNVWQGYAKSTDVKINTVAQGPAFELDKEVIIMKDNYKFWQNFSWKEKGSTKHLVGKEVIAKRKYHHYNGSVYYSIFDYSGEWLGYINKDAVK